MKFTAAILSVFVASVVALPYETQPCTSTATTSTSTTTGTPGDSAPAQDTPGYSHPPASHDISNNGGVQPTIHTVLVGGSGKLVYSPATIVAKKGDIVRFEFAELNHTVTESTFEKPCISRQHSANFFDTGFVANTGSTKPGPTRDLIVKHMSPRWFYCMQGDHCGKGMVFALNPPSDQKFAEFKYAAMIQNGTAPDGSGPGYGGAPSGTVSPDYPQSTGYPLPTEYPGTPEYPSPISTNSTTTTTSQSYPTDTSNQPSNQSPNQPSNQSPNQSSNQPSNQSSNPSYSGYQ